MDMNDTPFGFTPAWYELGLVDDAVLTQLRMKWDSGTDHNPEHYRYGVFRDFLAAHRPLDPELCTRLFELGAADPDQAMGGAMMADLVRLRECPSAVLEAAANSGREHLCRLVQRRSR